VREPGVSAEFVSDDLPVFQGIITHDQVRQSQNPRWKKQGSWDVFEAEGVCPVYCGPNTREQALSYARQRAGYGRAEIQVLDEAGSVAETITNEDCSRWSEKGESRQFNHLHAQRCLCWADPECLRSYWP